MSITISYLPKKKYNVINPILPEDIELLILNKIIKTTIEDFDLKYYKLRGVCKKWRNIIDNYDLNFKLHELDCYNKDIIRILISGCLINCKWLVKNNIVFDKSHLYILCNNQQTQMIKFLFSEPHRLYNMTKFITQHSMTYYKYTSMRDKCDPVKIACSFGNIELFKILYNYGFNVDENVILLSIKKQHYDLTKYLVYNSLKDLISGNYSEYYIVEILKAHINSYGNKSDYFIYYLINSSKYIFSIDSILIILDYSLKYNVKISDTVATSNNNYEGNMFLYLINWILNKYKKTQINLMLCDSGIQKIIYKYISEHAYPECIEFMKLALKYKETLIHNIYCVIYNLYNTYKHNRGLIKKNENILSQKDHMFNLVNLIEAIYKLDIKYCKLKNSNINVLLLYFLGSYRYNKIYSANEVFTNRVLMYISSKNHIRSIKDHKRHLNTNIIELFRNLEHNGYKLNLKECIKISVDYDDIELLRYFVDKL